MSSLAVNDFRFEVRRSSERRSLETTVGRTGEFILAAPSMSKTPQAVRLRAAQAHVDLAISTPRQTLLAATWWLHDNAAKKKAQQCWALFFALSD